MNAQSLNSPDGVRNVVVACLLGVVTSTVCLQQSLAQQSPSQEVIFADPLKQINWISGPQNVGVGDFANVNIPAGYRFCDAGGARLILENANTPVPNDLIGVLADKGGTWWAVLEYDKSGYVKSADMAQIDSAAVLKAVQKQLQNQDNGRGITSVTWQSQPAFDAQADSLAWSLQVQAGSSKTLNEGVALLGRYGVLEVTAVRSYPLAAAPALSQIVSQNISFKDGDAYSNYQNGDKVGEIGLAGLIAGNNSNNHATAAGAAAWVYWVYSGLAVCAAFAGGMVLVSRKKSRRHHSVRPAVSSVSTPAVAQAASVAQPAPAVQVASVAQAPAVLTNVKLNGSSKTNGSNGERNGKHFHRNRKKRVFNYPKFYTHVMKELSFHSYDASPSMANGKSRNGHTNGYTNGHNTNGANGHTHGTNGSNGSNGSESNGSVKTGIEELIATQKSLIQEQKCLLEQQTRLIEEKRWLIEEQTAFLKGQTGMMNEGQFPLKFE
ncbi:MAG TPA: DUF2167 domain-containing protein [Verrucomicrobiae bacterium]